MGKRTRYSAEFKAKGAIEAIRGKSNSAVVMQSGHARDP